MEEEEVLNLAIDRSVLEVIFGMKPPLIAPIAAFWIVCEMACESDPYCFQSCLMVSLLLLGLGGKSQSFTYQLLSKIKLYRQFS